MIYENYEIYEKHGAPVGATKLHYHNFYEIIYVMEGEFSSLVENTTYALKKGDFLLLDRNIMHNYHYIEKKHDSSRRIVLWITAEMLKQLGQGVDLSRCFSAQRAYAYHFPAHYEDLLGNLLMKIVMTSLPDMEQLEGKELTDRAHLTLFFVYLNELCRRKDFYLEQEETIHHPMVKAVTTYIETHIARTISVDELADYVHMSKYHFLRKFKEQTGMTVHRYITSKRLLKACKALVEGEPIAEVYQQAGFVDYSSFFRNFKSAYGVSPREFRATYKNEKTV